MPSDAVVAWHHRWPGQAALVQKHEVGSWITCWEPATHILCRVLAAPTALSTSGLETVRQQVRPLTP